MADHDWHTFDEEKGYEVKKVGDKYYVRQHGLDIEELTEDEFLKWRQPFAPNPKGLE